MRFPGGLTGEKTGHADADAPPAAPVADPADFFEDTAAEGNRDRRWTYIAAGAGAVVGLVVAGILSGMLDTSAAVPEKRTAVDDVLWQRPVITSKGDSISTASLAPGIDSPLHTVRLMTSFAGMNGTDLPGSEGDASAPSILQASLVLPETAPANETVILKSPPPEPEDRTFVLRKGERLTDRLVALGVPPEAARSLTRVLEPVLPDRADRDRNISVTLDRQQDFYGTEVTYPVFLSIDSDDGNRIVIEADEDGRFVLHRERTQTGDGVPAIRPRARPDDLVIRGTGKRGTGQHAEARFIRARGRISSSLYAAARDQNVPDYIIGQMMRAFSYSVDLQRQVAKGDTFDILYGVPMSGSSKRRKVLYYAALNMRNRKVVYYRYTTPEGRTGYFDEAGRSASRGLMATPISGARITSGFGMRRHPVLGYTRMHTGIDFGAPRGTPIRAAGSGIVTFAGWKGGYGRTVMIRHENGYVTLYAHQSRIARGIRKGVRVNQGQVIGYVGASGRVTGPHLHFEVRRNNRPINPRRVRTAHSYRLKGKVLAAFRKQKARIQALLKQAPSSDLVARR